MHRSPATRANFTAPERIVCDAETNTLSRVNARGLACCAPAPEGQRPQRTRDSEAVTEGFSPMPAPTSRQFVISPRLILWLIVAVVLVYGVIYPNAHVLYASLTQDGGWSLVNYRNVLS